MYDGDSSAASTLGNQTTGNTLPSVIASTGSDIFINLLSESINYGDWADGSYGFRVRYVASK